MRLCRTDDDKVKNQLRAGRWGLLPSPLMIGGHNRSKEGTPLCKLQRLVRTHRGGTRQLGVPSARSGRIACVESSPRDPMVLADRESCPQPGLMEYRRPLPFGLNGLEKGLDLVETGKHGAAAVDTIYEDG